MKSHVAEVAVAKLGVAQIIEEKIDLLYERLKVEQELVEQDNSSGKRALLTALLAATSIFINYASTREKLKAAQAWLRDELGIEDREEALTTLAALTLKYIVETGSQHAPDEEKLATWARMEEDVAAAAEELVATPAGR